ncbi:hypothetical protein ENSA5_58450 [Enhygromyxa salina]|uniref:DUF2169 domain-containing protein n=1 Tax=Enhygromyxa salina TaxID=215803 RepID=A0A2S9XE13_9BACT|nr:DUF2169 domain-containing protein [Enhygromyxa salina]PRP91108.1 hypothetical protein ENSA5_58450 [Enhygromyxa salina]
MSERQPARPNYDAELGLGGTTDEGPFAYVLAKLTYSLEDGTPRLSEPKPLLHDFREPDRDPLIVAGTDFWSRKLATDFVVQGSAFASRPTPYLSVTAAIGEVVKKINVVGRRVIEWHHGIPRVPSPEPFEVMPLTYENAYGGLDWRVPVDNAEAPEMQFILQSDHPGMYPRNPFGKGYMAVQGEVPEMELPNLEDPSDTLTDERLIARGPEGWYAQPLPWCFDWVHPSTFPRYVYLAYDVDAWFPGPEDAHMPEVRRGFVPPNYRELMSHRTMEQGPDPRYRQGASHGFVLPDVRGGEPVRIEGMHPSGRPLNFPLPVPPEIELFIENTSSTPRTRVHSIVVRPEELELTMTVGAWAPLHRTFLPGLHKTIPIAASIGGDAPIAYDAPTTIRDRIAEARANATS